jgi:hypothetical protein
MVSSFVALSRHFLDTGRHGSKYTDIPLCYLSMNLAPDLHIHVSEDVLDGKTIPFSLLGNRECWKWL